MPSYYWWCEALHGYNRLDSSSKGVYARNHEYENIGQWGPDNAVSYPMSLTVGNTWNPDLYYTEALEVGDEIRELTSRNPFTGNAIDLNFYSRPSTCSAIRAGAATRNPTPKTRT